MKDDNLEKHFRDGLKDLEAGPPDGSKEAIEKHLLDAGLLKDKADAKGGLWMFVLLAVLIATPVVYALKKTHKVQFAETNSAKSDVQSSSDNAIAYNENSKSDGNVKTGVINESNNIVVAKTKHSAAKNERKLAERKYVNAKIKPADSSSETLTTANTKTKKQAQASHIESSSEEVRQSAGDAPLANNDNDLSATIPGAVQADGSMAASTTTSEENSEEKAEVDKLEVKQDTLVEKQATALKDTTAHPKLPVERIHKEIAFDFSGAPQFNTIIYGNGTEYYQKYVNESRKSEKETPSFSAAFGLVLSLNRFIVETGIKHSILSSDFSFEQTLVTIDTSESHHGPTGWIHVEDSVESTTHYIANNKIAFMEFPMLAGYRFQAGKFEFELKAGPMMSFITSANTTVISLNTGTVVQSNDLNSSPYRKICWSFLSAGNILYSIGNRFSAFVQPSLKTGITSVFKESAPVTKKVQSVCVGIGLRVKL